MKWALRVIGLVSVMVLPAAFFIPFKPVVTEAQIPTPVEVSVPARALEVVCPGALVELGGEDGTEIDSLENIGDADFFLVEQSVPTPFRADQPASFTAETDVQLSSELSGYMWQSVERNRIIGTVSVSCKKPVTEAWMIAPGTELGKESLLVIHNPDVLSTILELGFYTDQALPSDSVSLAPGETKVLNLARYAPGESVVGLSLKSQGGRFAAWVQSKTNSGTTPTGADLVAHNQLQLNPSMLITVQDDELPEQDRLPEMFILSTQETNATISIGSLEQGFGDVIRAGLQVGVNQLQLPDLEPGSYRVSVESEAEVLLSSKTTNPLIADYFTSMAEPSYDSELTMVATINGVIEIASSNQSLATLQITRDGSLVNGQIGDLSGQSRLTADVEVGDLIEIGGQDLLVRISNPRTEYLPADNSNIGSDLKITVR